MLSTRIARAMLGASCALSFAAHPTLGQTVSTIGGDQTRLHAVAHTVATQNAYSVHLITMPSGTEVREFVAPNGIVFGVAWEGPTLPDLQAMLGASFSTYVAATATHTGAPLAVSNSDLVVYSSGHLRAFAGHAYLPQAVPAGVDVGVIQ